MEETYWCHACSRGVDPVRETEEIKCPNCEDGFLEEITPALRNEMHLDVQLGGSESDRALSLWAPILLGMVGNSRSRNRIRGRENDNQRPDGSEEELDRELELILRRRRSSSALLQLLQGIRSGVQSESEDSDTDSRTRDSSNSGERGREHVVLINPFNESAIIVGSYGRGNESRNHAADTSSLGDYFIGPRLDLLLQHLVENDPNRYGTPPALQKAVDALPIVQTEEKMQCSICLDDCEKGAEVKEMPCKHKFHEFCILPWLELHSSCPICRFQLPCDESKVDSRNVTNNNSGASNSQESNTHNHRHISGDSDDYARELERQLPWSLGRLFSTSRTQRSRGNSSANDTPSSSTSSREDEN